MKRLIIIVVLIGSCGLFLSIDIWSEDQLISFSDVDRPLRIIKKVFPEYPIEALRKGQEGKVIIQMIITKEGKVLSPMVISSIPEGVFDESALKAIKGWLFEPEMKSGKPIATRAIMPMAFKIDGLEGTGYDMYTEIQQGLGNMNAGNYPQAIECFSKAIKYFPDFPGNYTTYNYRGFAYRMTGEHEKAISDFNKAIDLDSKQATSYKYRGDTYAILKKYLEAVNDYSQAISLKPDLDQAYNSRGDIFRELGKYPEAVNDYNEVIRLKPDMEQTYNKRGDIYRQLGKYHDSVNDYSEVIRLKPDQAYPYLKRGYCYNKLGDQENTCKDFNKACELGDCRALDTIKKEGQCQ